MRDVDSTLESRRWLVLALSAALLALAAAVRLYHLGWYSLWLDEAYTYTRAALPAPQTIRASIAKGHVPTYFLFMHYFIALGDDERMLRLPSAIFGVLTVAISVVLGRIAGGLRVGLATGLLVALCPLQVRYSQEARMYTMYTFAAAIAMSGVLWLLAHPEQAGLGLWRRRSWMRSTPGASPIKAWLAYVLGAAGALYLHNTGVFLIATCSCCVLVVIAVAKGRRWAVVGNWVLANLAVLGLWSFWIAHLLVQTNKVLHRFWPDFPTPRQMYFTLKEMYLYSIEGHVWINLLLLISVLLGLFALRKRRSLAIGLLVLSILPPVLVLLVSLRTPMFMPRIMLWAPIPFFALAAAGIFALPWPALPPLFLCALLAAGGVALHDYYFGYTSKPPWKEVATLLKDNYDSKTRVLAARTQDLTVLNYYFGRRTNPVGSVPVAVVAPAHLRRYVRGAKHVWLVDQKRGKRSGHHRAELLAIGTLVRQERHGGIQVIEIDLGR